MLPAFHTIPLEAMKTPPLSVIVPPLVALLERIFVIAAVVNIGATGGSVVNDKSAPYTVLPDSLVAYALT